MEETHIFILSLPRIWLSRSTSKIDALDDDETPLRLTASQTVITGGVMVSSIMGALDIASRLHFVDPGLKTSGEERIKATGRMHCAQLRGPHGARACVFIALGHRAVARFQAGL